MRVFVQSRSFHRSLKPLTGQKGQDKQAHDDHLFSPHEKTPPVPIVWHQEGVLTPSKKRQWEAIHICPAPMNRPNLLGDSQAGSVGKTSESLEKTFVRLPGDNPKKSPSRSLAG
jgi:hypothetical protein